MTDKERQDLAWNTINKIYEAVRTAAPWTVNTTAWYDFGAPIIQDLIKKLETN